MWSRNSSGGLEQSLNFDFKTSNNQTEYEAILTGLTLANEMEAC